MVLKASSEHVATIFIIMCGGLVRKVLTMIETNLRVNVFKLLHVVCITQKSCDAKSNLFYIAGGFVSTRLAFLRMT